jgi:hypothetical protein
MMYVSEVARQARLHYQIAILFAIVAIGVAVLGGHTTTSVAREIGVRISDSLQSWGIF